MAIGAGIGRRTGTPLRPGIEGVPHLLGFGLQKVRILFSLFHFGNPSRYLKPSKRLKFSLTNDTRMV